MLSVADSNATLWDPDIRDIASLLLEVDEVDDDDLGCAMVVVGAYVTPLRFAACWNTEPFPYS